MQPARFRAMGTDVTVLLLDAPADAPERAAARTLQAEITAMPAPADVVPALEALVSG